MEARQYELCISVIERLNNTGILKDVILVGSWCAIFYKDFLGNDYISSITTRDMDLLIPQPSKLDIEVDVAELLKDLGFIIGFTGQQGYIRLEHPLLIVEFLVPEKGKGMNKPYKLPKLGVNAQALRFLDFLSLHTINVKIGDYNVKLPHPVNFGLHKLLIISRRNLPYKKLKDKDTAIKILNALIARGQADIIKERFTGMPKKWQNAIKRQLTDITDEEILRLLEM